MMAQPGSHGSKGFTAGSRPTDVGQGQEVKYSSLDRAFPAGSPLASALVIIVGTLVIAASIVVGFFAFLILGSVLMVVAAIVSIRMWWFRRKLSRDPAFRQSHSSRDAEDGRTIEGEYRVVIEERDGRGD
jgi:hypothetical protein